VLCLLYQRVQNSNGKDADCVLPSSVKVVFALAVAENVMRNQYVMRNQNQYEYRYVMRNQYEYEYVMRNQ
jgi:hypothetical protein